MEEILAYRFEEYIDAPIDVVFQYVDEDEKIKLWNTMFVENIYETETGKQESYIGVKFKSIQKIEKKTITIDCEIMEYEPPYKVVIHSHTKEGMNITRYTLLREHHGTKIVVEASIVPSNLFYKIMTKMFRWAGKIMFEEQFKNMKTYIETEVTDY
ncbi:SRPBCC family protein [Bacillus kwashiorkori]|uniref:SRPBCC family protein n=1 Tax=Bacillus kwashiorkori TaxID=1522318 RepID=UPI0007845CBF|nr:SRPBCC family protein [Bacillus kwashiorkori]